MSKRRKITHVGRRINLPSGDHVDIHASDAPPEAIAKMQGVLMGIPYEKEVGPPEDIICCMCGAKIGVAPKGMFPKEALHACHRHTALEQQAFFRALVDQEQES